MTDEVMQFLRTCKETYEISGKALDVGALNINGSSKSVFGGVGVDIVSGRDVDYVIDSKNYKYPFNDEEFDVVTCCETLEHDKFPKKTFSEIARVLRPGGYFILTVDNNKGNAAHSGQQFVKAYSVQELKKLLFEFQILDIKETSTEHIFIISKKEEKN